MNRMYSHLVGIVSTMYTQYRIQKCGEAIAMLSVSLFFFFSLSFFIRHFEWACGSSKINSHLDANKLDAWRAVNHGAWRSNSPKLTNQREIREIRDVCCVYVVRFHSQQRNHINLDRVSRRTALNLQFNNVFSPDECSFFSSKTTSSTHNSSNFPILGISSFLVFILVLGLLDVFVLCTCKRKRRNEETIQRYVAVAITAGIHYGNLTMASEQRTRQSAQQPWRDFPFSFRRPNEIQSNENVSYLHKTHTHRTMKSKVVDLPWATIVCVRNVQKVYATMWNKCTDTILTWSGDHSKFGSSFYHKVNSNGFHSLFYRIHRITAIVSNARQRILRWPHRQSFPFRFIFGACCVCSFLSTSYILNRNENEKLLFSDERCTMYVVRLLHANECQWLMTDEQWTMNFICHFVSQRLLLLNEMNGRYKVKNVVGCWMLAHTSDANHFFVFSVFSRE